MVNHIYIVKIVSTLLYNFTKSQLLIDELGWKSIVKIIASESEVMAFESIIIVIVNI